MEVSLEHSIEDTNTKLVGLLEALCQGLNDNVYSPEAIDIIEEARVILDFATLAVMMKDEGGSAVNVFLTKFPKFKTAVKKIPIKSLENVPDEELKIQYKLFLERLEKVTENIEIKKLKEMDNKVLILNFFYPKQELFKNIEAIMQAIAVSAVKHSCESILESFVSMYENHFDIRRPTAEKSTNEEFEIAVNGPNLAHCDSVVKESMDNYWASRGGKWHFFKTSVLETNSQVIKRLMSTKNNFPFMD